MWVASGEKQTYRESRRKVRGRDTHRRTNPTGEREKRNSWVIGKNKPTKIQEDFAKKNTKEKQKFTYGWKKAKRNTGANLHKLYHQRKRNRE